MNTHVSIPIPTKTFLALADFLKNHHSDRDPVVAVTDAINYWLDNADWKPEDLMPEIVVPSRGYTWKYKDSSLFLPHGTEIRMRYKGKYHYAVVDGDEIKYDGQSVTPAYFANLITSTSNGLGSRNAWKDLWIKCPSYKEWMLADDRRKAMKKFADDFLREEAL